MTDKIFFEETSSGMFVKKFLADKTFEEMDDFCYRIRDGILYLMQNVVKENRPNLSNQELLKLQKCIKNTNNFQVIKDFDKKLSAVRLDKNKSLRNAKDNFLI